MMGYSKTYTRRSTRKKPKDETLIDLYHNQLLPASEIATRYHVKRATVYNWLTEARKNLGITLTEKGEDDG